MFYFHLTFHEMSSALYDVTVEYQLYCESEHPVLIKIILRLQISPRVLSD